MFLLDTVILSELRRPVADPSVLAWFHGQEPSAMFLSVVSIGEMERGIASQRRADPVFAQTLSAWLALLMDDFADRILPVDARIARRCGQLSARLGHNGVDLMIAATALEHGLTVATRNVRHFVPTGVAVENPFE